MKMRRPLALMAAGLFGASLLLSPLAYAQGTTTGGSGMMEGHKGAVKQEGTTKKTAKKKSGALKKKGAKTTSAKKIGSSAQEGAAHK